MRSFGLGVVGRQALAGLGGGQHVVIVVAGIDADLAIVHVGHVGADLVQEVPVVADDDHRALVAVEHVLQPADRIDVQVVGGLVQQQHVGVGEQRLRQQHAQLPAGRDFAHEQVVLVHGDLQAQQEFAGARFGRVAVVFGELGFQVGRAHIVVFGGLWVGVDRVALGHGRPHLGVAHHDHVQHPYLLEGELVLAQLAQPHAGFERHVARRGLEVAADDFHEGRLAGTVGPDQTIPVAFPELDADVFEKRLGAELDSEIGSGNHGVCASLTRRKGAMEINPVVYQVAPLASPTRRRCRRGDICAGARVIPDVRLIVRQRHARFNPPGPIDNERLLKETRFVGKCLHTPSGAASALQYSIPIGSRAARDPSRRLTAVTKSWSL